MRARARTASISDWLARGPGPHISWTASSGRLFRPGGADEVEDRLDDAVPHGQRPHEALAPLAARRDHHRAGRLCSRAGRLEQDAALGVAARVGDVDLQEEAVELRFGQRVGPSCSIGFCVASTWNGRGRSCRSPATETWCSCIA
jgi:hypothetical protein